MSASLIILLAIQAVSLLLMGLFYFEYRHIQLQRAEMFHQLEHSKEPILRGTRMGIVYLVGTLVILLASVLFFFSFSLHA